MLVFNTIHDKYVSLKKQIRQEARNVVRTLTTAIVLLSMLLTNGGVSAQPSATVGQGFTITPADLAFILKQIKIAERHSRAFEGDLTAAPQPNPNPAADPSYCLSMIGPDVDQVPDPLTTYGLRTVDGQCNNLKSVLNTTNALNNHPVPTFTNSPTLGSADQPFPRLTTPVFRDAEAGTTYAQKLAGNVVNDTQPRMISNLIDDQTSTNPAAVIAAGFPVRAQNGGNPTVACAVDPLTGLDVQPLTPLGCVPQYQTLFIENVTTDVGLSPPYNVFFSFFGQFFDHGVDQTVKSGGTVLVPLRADDPLIAGPDHILVDNPLTLVNEAADNLPPALQFMTLPRAQNQPGPDGVLGTADDVQDANNTDTPWVDQSQTYTSHSSHQVFLREYVNDIFGHPVSTGKFLNGQGAGVTYPGSPDGTLGMSTWFNTKKQAAEVLGLLLKDTDVTNIPMLLTDPYGKFIPGPLRSLPQYVTTTGLVEGCRVTDGCPSPVPVPANVLHFDTPFLTDIAHNADPGSIGPCDTFASGTPAGCKDPDADLSPSADFAAQPSFTYDNEMLDAHFTCGDGRCNENIALSTVHQIFHSEHNRLVEDIKNVLMNDPNDTFGTVLAQWKVTTIQSNGNWNGERLFQAARFITEMEYQHLVFEEFARKLQPAVRLFHVYSPDINPAIKAEYAHAVYRFGHSMLHDTIARITVDPFNPNIRVDNQIPLLDAFLNPPELFNPHGTLSGSTFYNAEQGAGAVIMGTADMAGNDLDEFLAETLRNHLVGLPLDLATLNISRGRSEGIPPLNQVRRDIFAQTNDGQLAPYTSWLDFGQHLKHPASLINFVAAYGTHPTITAATTVTGKRLAARAIVDPQLGLGDVPPADAADFMFSTGAWASDANGVTTTGLDSVDMWIGALAENTNLFGGLLGTTNNYVFQSQLESLQDGDRFYYLARTPGMNLRTQLEGNSFSELIMRNTQGTDTLKADAFATADCKFQLANLNGTPAGFALLGSTVVDDLTTTDCNENLLLQRDPNGTIRYKAVNTVDPVGINGQSVYNGTDTTNASTLGVDRIFGGNDNDTFWGGFGNDVIEGNGGDDVALGGEGNDILTDNGTSDADVQKGGPGNDAIDGGGGDDIPMGGLGNDFINGGAGDNETFAGPGNDFIIAGQGADAVFGDSGDDWIEGGSGQDLLQGDHGAPFFDDPAQVKPGNDIFIGQVGENDYDAEGGDDLMSQNAAVDRNAGAAGFDWAFHQFDTVGANDDMLINQQLVGVPIQLVVNRDRWQETEADSGGKFNDIIRGDSMERVVGPGGFSGCDALDLTGVARIAGLDKLVNTFPSSLADVITASIMGQCPLTGFGGTLLDPTSGTVWAQGNILLGGGGSDVLTGRGSDDIIDGDHFLAVRISVLASVDANGNPTGAELGTTDLMENKATSGNFGPGTAGMTLQQAVFAGLVNPGQLLATRELPTMGASANAAALSDCPAFPAGSVLGNAEDVAAPVGTVNCDIATYASPFSNYTITNNADGSVTVLDNASAALADPITGTVFVKGDGTDTLWNMEALRFCTANDAVTKKCSAFETRFIGLTTPVPAATLSATTLNFGSLTVGASIAQNVTLSNTGSAPLLITNITASNVTGGSFTQTNTCPSSLAAGLFCTITATFTPAAAGTSTGSITITDNAGNVAGSTQSVALTGIGLAPIASLSPASLTFASQLTGTTSAALPVTLSNTGNGPLNISSITASGDFAQTNTCGASLGAGLSCTINVTFAPVATGTRTGLLTVNHNAAPVATSTSITLSGTGIASISLTPPSLTFANQNIGSVSALQSMVLRNIGAVAVTTTSVTVGGPNANQFQVTIPAGCIRTRNAGATFCTISVRFAPTLASGAGLKTATVTVASNGGTIVANLSGTAVAVATISVPATLNLGRHPLNSTTTTTLTVTNIGSAPLQIGALTVTGSAAYSATLGTCTNPVAAGGTCQITVIFKPTVAGNPITGTLTIASNASNGTQTVALTGRAP